MWLMAKAHDEILESLYRLKTEAQIRECSDTFIAGIQAAINQTRVVAGLKRK